MFTKKSLRIDPRLLDGLFLACLGVYIFLGLSRVPFHGDESTFIRLSLDYAYLFQDRDIAKVAYRADLDFWSEEQFQRVLTGAVNPLSIGLSWNLAEMDRGGVNGFWRWYPRGADEWTYNVRAGNMPAAALLNVARIPSTLFTALSIVVVFAAAHLLSRSRPAAWLAALLYAAAPAVLVNGRRAMQEGAMLLFTSLVVLCGLLVARELRVALPRRGRITLEFCLLGVVSGCALASKHTSALVLAPVYLALTILILRSSGGENRISRLRLLSGLCGSGLLGLSVFYMLMPVWWSFPLHWLLLLCLSALCFCLMIAGSGWSGWFLRALPAAAVIGLTLARPVAWDSVYQPIRIIVEGRAELTRVHNTLGLDLPTYGARVGEMADQLISARTQYYESLVWDTLEEEQAQIRTYEAAHLDGRGGGAGWGIVIVILIFGGMLALLFHRHGWESFYLFLWMFVPALGLLLVNTLAWQRYYLVLIAPWSVLAGFAAVPLTSSVWIGRIRKMFSRKIPLFGLGPNGKPADPQNM
jgi:hypothetical protein